MTIFDLIYVVPLMALTLLVCFRGGVVDRLRDSDREFVVDVLDFVIQSRVVVTVCLFTASVGMLLELSLRPALKELGVTTGFVFGNLATLKFFLLIGLAFSYKFLSELKEYYRQKAEEQYYHI